MKYLDKLKATYEKEQEAIRIASIKQEESLKDVPSNIMPESSTDFNEEQSGRKRKRNTVLSREIGKVDFLPLVIFLG
jgi:hypothetical protein